MNKNEVLKNFFEYTKLAMNEIILNKEQAKAFSEYEKGKNLFITGPSGVGKSLLVQLIVEDAISKCKKIGITSTTGVSAQLLGNGATTVHSYLGLGLGRGTPEAIAGNIMKKSYLRNRWTELRILIIDEVSMLSGELFDKIVKVAEIVRNAVRPRTLKAMKNGTKRRFGGIQLICTGDFLQLPPVKSEFRVFETQAWEDAIDEKIELVEIVRQKDKAFQDCLNKIRKGVIDESVIELLDSRIDVPLETKDGIKPTRIYNTNQSVDEINDAELDELDDGEIQFYEYEIDFEFTKFCNNRAQTVERFMKNSLIRMDIQLCVGAQVMLLVNMDIERELVNGSRGIVVDFVDNMPKVKFQNGIETVITPHVWEHEESEKLVMYVKQLPLKLAWAITTHKCVAPDTLVATDNGLVRMVDFTYSDQINGESRQMRESVIGENDVHVANQIFKGVPETMYCVRTSTGHVIKGSARHPIRVMGKYGEYVWKKLPELTLNDTVVLHCSTNSFGSSIFTSTFVKELPPYMKIPMVVDARVAKFIGEYMYGEQIGEDMTGYYDIFGHVKTEEESQIIHDFMEWCGVTDDYRVPWVILRNSEETQIEFLKSMFIYLGGEEYQHYASSEGLAEDLLVMLLNMGILARKLTDDSSICVTISNIVLSNGEKINSFDKIARKFYTFETEYGGDDTEYDDDELKPPELERHSGCVMDDCDEEDDDIEHCYDTIVSIDTVPNKVLYDIFVPEDHTFVGNGFINHNSQGSSIDMAEVDLSNVFENGQAYVMLSRLRTLEGLSIRGNIAYSKITADPRALEYYKEISEEK